MWTVTGPSFSPALPETAAGDSATDALGSATFLAFASSQSASFSAFASLAVTSALSEKRQMATWV